MTNKSTHTGICQACGRRQAVHVKSGLIAKHGYTTEYGFFNGTCGGSDELPLELDTKVNIKIVAATYHWAAEQEAKANGEITTVPVEVGSHYRAGHRIPEIKSMDRAEFEATQPSYKKFDNYVDLLRHKLRRSAEIARADAAQLDALRDKVHGEPLQPRKVEAPIKREFFKTYREAYARVDELKARGIEARARRGSYVGQPHTVTYR